MRFACPPLLALLIFASASRADDAADARAMVARGIKAAGIPTDGKPIAMTWKDKGKFSGGGIEMPYTADWAFQGPDKYRFALSGEFGGMKIDLLVVVNGNKAWESGFGMKREITGPKLEQTLGEVYHLHVMSLTPLLVDKEFKLSLGGEQLVNDRKMTAVKVERGQKPAVILFFDRETGLLTKVEAKVKDEFQDWKDVTDETYLSDYKDVGGRKYFTKMRILRDGKPMIESTLFDQKPSEKLDPKMFEAIK